MHGMDQDSDRQEGLNVTLLKASYLALAAGVGERRWRDSIMTSEEQKWQDGLMKAEQSTKNRVPAYRVLAY